MKRTFLCGGGARGRIALALPLLIAHEPGRRAARRKRRRIALALPLLIALLLVILVTAPAWAAGTGGQRDPFHSLIPKAGSGKAAVDLNRPEGRAGLEIDQLSVQGLAIGGPTGPVALVAGRSGATYFLRPGEHVFDGVVLRLTPDGIWFRRTKVVANGQVSGQQTFRAMDPAPGGGK